MGRLLSFVLTVVFFINAAFAGANALTIEMDHAGQPVGHHTHSGGGDHDHAPDPGEFPAPDEMPSHSGDHQHSHTHPVFSPVLPAAGGVAPTTASVRPAVLPDERLNSVLLPRPDRPPRTIPVV